MSRKPVRFGLLIVGLLITAAVAYRAVDNEASLGRVYRESVAHNLAAGQALEALQDLRASLYAYVAPGQGVPFWSRRAEQLLDSLRQHLVALDAAVAPRGGSLAETLDAVDQLAAAERRSRDYTRRGETLLAGDVVFTEVRDLLAAAAEQIYTARTTLAAAHDRRVSALRREQAMLGGAAVVTWIAITLLLMTPAKADPVKDPAAWREELAQTIKKPLPAPAPQAPQAPQAPMAPMAPVSEPGVAVTVLRDVGEICADLSSLADTGALSGALDRAAAVLGASGVIVWIASNDGNSLSPVASHGFDQKLVTRIGRIPRDSANLTAAAFRENVPRVSAATPTAPAALAVSLCGPSGSVGVLSAELKPDVPADDARVALATIFAAQLATLANPIPSASATTREQSGELRRDREAASGREGGPASKVEQSKTAAL
jgi:hypothetical protein